MQKPRHVGIVLQTPASQTAPAGVRNWHTYALGWVAASAIVAARYLQFAIDAVPVYHPAHGWDRFLLTRRVSCLLCGSEPADAFGCVMLDGPDAPLLVHPDGTVAQALGPLFRHDPEAAIAAARAFVPAVGLLTGDHAQCWHTAAPLYPTLYAVVSNLVARYPSLTVAREVFVDDTAQGGMFHPLFLHAGAKLAGVCYDWFVLQTPDDIAYLHITGGQAIYLRDDGNWSTVRTPLSAEDPAGMARRILAWLRLEGAPDAATVD